MENRTIIFRADGNSDIGLGHLVRSSALAAMLREQYACVLATRCRMIGQLPDVRDSFTRIIELPEKSYEAEAAEFHNITGPADLVVLDGYAFDGAYQHQLTRNGFDLFSIDDIHSFKFHSKVIINHAGGITPLDYAAWPFTQYFLGPHYSLLRGAFLRAAKDRRNAISDNNCIVCFGGADPVNRTMQVVQDLCKRSDQVDHIHVVVGSAYRFHAELNDFIGGRENISVRHAVSTEEMVRIMQQCSFAVCSPSSVLYEYLSVGGVACLVMAADNQQDVFRFFTTGGIAFDYRDFGNIPQAQVERSFELQAHYFDGRSDERFRKLFRQFFESKKLVARKAGGHDLPVTYAWANDPDVRQQSYSQHEISFEEHSKWFSTKISASGSYYYILELDGTPVAQVRFQVSGSEAVIGYLADRSIRSRGLGTAILAKGIEALTCECDPPLQIVGYVKESNVASQRSFERLAFRKTKSSEYPGSYKYILNYGD